MCCVDTDAQRSALIAMQTCIYSTFTPIHSQLKVSFRFFSLARSLYRHVAAQISNLEENLKHKLLLSRWIRIMKFAQKLSLNEPND